MKRKTAIQKGEQQSIVTSRSAFSYHCTWRRPVRFWFPSFFKETEDDRGHSIKVRFILLIDRQKKTYFIGFQWKKSSKQEREMSMKQYTDSSMKYLRQLSYHGRYMSSWITALEGSKMSTSFRIRSLSSLWKYLKTLRCRFCSPKTHMRTLTGLSVEHRSGWEVKAPLLLLIFTVFLIALSMTASVLLTWNRM